MTIHSQIEFLIVGNVPADGSEEGEARLILFVGGRKYPTGIVGTQEQIADRVATLFTVAVSA